MAIMTLDEFNDVVAQAIRDNKILKETESSYGEKTTVYDAGAYIVVQTKNGYSVSEKETRRLRTQQSFLSGVEGLSIGQGRVLLDLGSLSDENLISLYQGLGDEKEQRKLTKIQVLNERLADLVEEAKSVSPDVNLKVGSEYGGDVFHLRQNIRFIEVKNKKK